MILDGSEIRLLNDMHVRVWGPIPPLSATSHKGIMEHIEAPRKSYGEKMEDRRIAKEQAERDAYVDAKRAMSPTLYFRHLRVKGTFGRPSTLVLQQMFMKYDGSTSVWLTIPTVDE